jgi:predicted dehydrogenase
MKPLGFGIIGCGGIAITHVAGIKGAEGAELVAVYDAVPERAQEFAEKYGPAEVCRDYHQLLARPDVDVVNICTPSGLHGEITMAAAKAGKHVMCEKPLETTVEKCDAMIRACHEAGVKLGVILQSRTYPATIKVKKAIDEGKFGTLTMGDMNLKWYRSQEYYDRGGWRGTWKFDGGGALMNQGIHGVDVLQYLMGPVESVCAYADTLGHRMETEDTVVAAVRFRNGALGCIEATTTAYPGVDRRIEIAGTKGTVALVEDDIAFWKLEGDDEEITGVGTRHSDQAADPLAGLGAGHLAQIEDMIAAIREDRAPLVTGEDALPSVEIITAIYESARTGKMVKLRG